MDPPPPPSTAVAGEPTSKIRLLFSYGGHIVPKPNSGHLTYSGGDTKIVSLHRATLSLSSLTSHLSRTFHAPSFVIKYQLPGEDLDSLISVTTDEDLRNMVEEHDRISAPSRIRLFLFPVRAESLGTVGSKWFGDALEGALEGVMQRGVSADSGLLGLNFGADVAGGKGGTGQESMVMETGSSFGSTGSSVSMTNLPSSGGMGQGEENGVFEKRTKLPSSGSIESDNNTPTATPQQYTGIYQDPSIHPITTETMSRSTLVESNPIFHNPQSNFQVLKTVQAGAHQPSGQIHHQQQELQYIQTGTQHYIPQYSGTPSYYPMYYPPLNQHTHNPYQQNPPYPVYYVPVRPTQAYNTPMPPHPQMHTHVPKEVVSASAPLVQVPINQNQQQLVDISDINPTTQPVINSEYEDEFAYTQIYKTQPSGPTLISQYQTMTSGDNIK